jgi:hypothetical protein
MALLKSPRLSPSLAGNICDLFSCNVVELFNRAAADSSKHGDTAPWLQTE